jgi:ubiquinone/menaquinone biosynthesis C-methylase UbiE
MVVRVSMKASSIDPVVEPKTWGTYWDIFGEKLVGYMEIPEGAKILDVGSGGGSVLYPLARRVGPRGHVTGVELCDHCAKNTASEIRRCNIKNAESIYLDARQTRFADASFDCITAGFIGWDDYFDFQKNEYIKPDLLMQEITRLLKPGGQFGMSTWLLQEDLDWMYQFLTSQSIESRRNYHSESERGWRKILSEWGYIDIQAFVETATYAYDSIDLWWKEMTDYDWIENDSDKEIIESMKSPAFERIRSKIEGGKIPFARRALFVIGKKKGVLRKT